MLFSICIDIYLYLYIRYMFIYVYRYIDIYLYTLKTPWESNFSFNHHLYFRGPENSLLYYYHFCCPSFILVSSGVVIFVWRISFSVSCRAVLLVINCFTLFNIHFWRLPFLHIDSWMIARFFQSFEYVIPLSSDVKVSHRLLAFLCCFNIVSLSVFWQFDCDVSQGGISWGLLYLEFIGPLWCID